MEFVLERQHTRDRSRYVFNETRTSHTCGRGKDNTILCISLLVSRKHCMFLVCNNMLYVVDLRSSNGVYINGRLQNSMEPIKLNENDIIGIGTPDFNPNDDEIFSYKVYTIPAPLIEEDNEISILSRTFVTREVRKTPESSTERVVGEKCKSSSTNCSNITSCKRQKCSIDHSVARNTSEDESDDEIEILHASLVNKIQKQFRDSDASTSTKCLNNNIKLSPNNKSHTNFPNNNNASVSNDASTSTNCLNNNIKLSPNNKSHSNFPNNNNASVSNDKFHTNLPNKNKRLDSNDKNCKNNIKDNNQKQKSDLNHRKDDEEMCICIDEDDTDNDNDRDMKEMHIRENSPNNAEPHKKHILEKTLNNDNNPNIVSDAKLENEMQTVNEKTNNHKRNNHERNNHERNNHETNNHETPCDTPSKIVKQIKREPMTRFSEVNVVELSSDEEDSMFPYSQLFDMKKDNTEDDNTEHKVEIKQECTDENVENSEKIGLLDIDDEVIILTDTEDEDNPWLERLSRSQLLNEENEKDQEEKHSNILFDLSDDDNNTNTLMAKINAMDIDDVSSPNEFDMANADDTSNKQEIDTENDGELDKRTEKDTSSSPVSTPVVEAKQKRVRKTVTTPLKLIPIIEPIKLGPGRRQRCKYSKDRKATPKEKVITEEKMSKLKEKLKDDFYAKKQKHRKKKSESASGSHSPNEAKPGPSISKSEKRVIMEKRKMKLKEIAEEKKRQEAAKNNRDVTRRIAKPRAKLTLKNRGDFLLPEQDLEVDTEPAVTPSHSDISAEVPKSSNDESKQQSDETMSKEFVTMSKLIDDQLKVKLNKTDKPKELREKSKSNNDRSKLLNKTDVPREFVESKSSSDRSKPSNKTDTPKKLTESRSSNSDQLKKSVSNTDASKESTKSKSNKLTESKSNNNDHPEKPVSKTDALKESTKSKSNNDRSKKLINNTDVPKEFAESKSNNDRSKKLVNKPDVPKEFGTSSDTVERKSSETHAINNIATSLQRSLNLDNTEKSAEDNAFSRTTSEEKKKKRRSRSRSKESRRSYENTRETVTNRVFEPKQDGFDKYLSNVPNFPPNNMRLSSERKKNRVTFSDRVEVREYEIDSRNSLKKLVGKDAPIPANKLVKKSPITEWRPKLEEFLLRIFMWNPVWLEEQRNIREDPPIISPSELQNMHLRYDSYKQYYDVAMPLLLLEIWQIMTREFEQVRENKMKRATAVCSIIENSITRTPIPSTNLFLTTLMIEVLVKKEDFNARTHPVYGELVFLEYVRKINGKQIFFKVFAYVINMHQTILTDFTHYNRNLRNHVDNPFAVITYTLWTRPVEHDIPVNRVHRVRTVMYLRPSIRMVQALQYLPQSALLKPILNPRIEDYELPLMSEPYTCSSLVTKDDLNPKQLEAVFRVTTAVLRKEAKLCFIQGPPGTGKSKVIVNLVTQILYGERRYEYNHKSLRILVCAPSNAAIDELVLRLLNVRSTLNHKRFNMVRIGRPETMHPLAKTVSVTDLARRHLTKMTQKSTSSVDAMSNAEDISIVEARLNSLHAELEGPQQMPEEKKKILERKLLDLRTKYELMKYGKSYEQLSLKERAKFERMSENVILAGADVITCTLSSCYTNQMESLFGNYKEKISVCIVDEATQSCEAETLIPLMLGVKTLVLVGDPNQLPATILSQRAKKMGLDQSIFSRVQNVFSTESNNPIIMLDTQYQC
ncbi:putative uncharacterized protein DDB_G0282133 isoform X2 [Pseudomyrmex gracilis]|uniref:putative uncharacterized protein DDB_G0282133 isoform X2 n=1 Tax=Pseudomyrmex gracilis TaxID=219809 RepID=UPI000994F352|nr:putative uncharacterized protein DDB_G0282133 isoform X2 [Pseudomyrmex gracilis]